MVLYINGKKAKSLYYNGKKIKEAWRNGVKVFSSEPYAPGTVFVNSAAPKTLTMELEPGVYYIDVTGGGPTSTCIPSSKLAYWGGPASAASCYGEFLLTKKSTIALTAGLPEIYSNSTTVVQANTDGTCFLDGVEFLRAGKANTNSDNNGVIAGGVATITFPSFVTNINLVGKQGNSGTSLLTSKPAEGIYGVSVSPHGWGAGPYTGDTSRANWTEGSVYGFNGLPGGIYLEYRRSSV